jgi:superfamily II DNA or RNA helicase
MKQVTINVGNVIRLSSIPHHFIPKLREKLIMENPVWVENEKRNRFNGKTPPKLRFISEDSKTIPRGFLRELRKMLIEAQIPYRIRRNNISYPISIESLISFDGKPHQTIAISKVLKRKAGVLEAPTGSGKTVMAIETICQRKERTLIVVHTKELLYQWRDRLLQFTNLREDEIGLLGDGKKKSGKVTVGIINTLRSLTKKSPKYFNKSFGYVIVDECHRIPSNTFSKFIVDLDTKYMLGLSATPYRRDGLDLVIKFFMGDVIHKIQTKKLQKDGHILKAKLEIIKTFFSPYIDSKIDGITSMSYQAMLNELVTDEGRNQIIFKKVREQCKKDAGVVLIISDRVGHCKTLYNKLSKMSDYKVVMVTGASTKKEREKALEALNKGEAKILIATGQLIGEGFDLKHLSSVFLTFPIKYDGRLTQYIGRVLRIADGKEGATIYDFNDPCWLLRGSYNSRVKYYKEMEMMK